MTYQEFQDLCEKKHTSVTAVSTQVGISFSGLKKGLTNESLSMKTVMQICQILEIDPNTFCRWESGAGDVNYGNMQKGGKKNTITVGSSEELKQAISIMEQQLREKDAQIAKLIDKL